MTRGMWQARQFMRSIGWQGVLGLALLAAGIGIAATAVPAQQHALDQAQQDTTVLRQRLRLAGQGGVQRPQTREDKLAGFYAYFPPLKSLPDWLERIYAAAESSGVQLDVGEYKLVQERNWKLSRYKLTLPVKGSYAQIRGFMAGVLADVPAAAVDEIDFRREAIGSGTLDARVRLTLYMGRGG